MKTTKQSRWTAVALLISWLAVAPLAQAFYNPNTGRWLNRDPAGEGREQNLNAFGINSPMNKIDHMGLRVVETIQDPAPGEPTVDDAGGQYTIDPTGGYHSDSCGPESAKLKMTYENGQTITLDIKIRYKSGVDPDATTLPSGRSVRQHERAHVSIWRSYWSEIDSLLTRRHGKCLCVPCYDAQENYYIARRAVALTVAAIANAQLDIEDSNPGSETEASRKRDKKLFEDSLTRQSTALDEASREMSKVCIHPL